jgi:hypothetical protein
MFSKFRKTQTETQPGLSPAVPATSGSHPDPSDPILAADVVAALGRRPQATEPLARTLGRQTGAVRRICRELEAADVIRRSGARWVLVPPTRCHGISTESGEPCRRQAESGSLYCIHHEPTDAPAGPTPLVNGDVAANTRAAWHYLRYGIGAGFERTAKGRALEYALKVRAAKWIIAHDPAVRAAAGDIDRTVPGALAALAAEPDELPKNLYGLGIIEFFDLIEPHFNVGDPDLQIEIDREKPAGRNTHRDPRSPESQDE